MDEVPGTTRKLPRGQASLTRRAKKLIALPHHIHWRDAIDRADAALIRRAAQETPVRKVNLPRLTEALDKAEASFTPISNQILNQNVEFKPGVVESYKAQTDDIMSEIQAFLQKVPDATVSWRGLTISVRLDG